MIPLATRYCCKLRLHYDGGVEEYDQACIGGLRAKPPRGLFKVEYAHMPHQMLVKAEIDYYLRFISGMGFNTSNPYVENQETVNITMWFANLTVLRYLGEAPNLVKWIASKVYQEGTKLDPWALFVTAHHVHGAQSNYNHCLVPANTDEYLDIPAIMKALKADVTGWDFSKLKSLNVTFANAKDYFFQNNVTEDNWRDYYTQFLAKKGVNEKKSTAT